MSTNSTVGILNNEDNSVRYIYGHWDGYPSEVGNLLLHYYETLEKATQLIDLGDFSVLSKSLEKPPSHDFDNPTKGFSTFYGRDRGEKGSEAVKALCYLDMSTQEFNYVFNPEKKCWTISVGDQHDYVKLTKKRCKGDD